MKSNETLAKNEPHLVENPGHNPKSFSACEFNSQVKKVEDFWAQIKLRNEQNNSGFITDSSVAA